MKDVLLGIGIFFITLLFGTIIRRIWNLIKKPSHNETKVKGELYAVTVYLYRIGRYSPGGNWYDYSFIKKNKYWKYKLNRFSVLVGLIIYAVMIGIIGLFCINAENGYVFFIHVIIYIGIALLAGGLVDPLCAYCYILRLEHKYNKRK